jgi:uncharacterized protein
MCCEILDEHKVHVKRNDRDELLEIRNGCWTYEQLIDFADSQEKEIDEKYKQSTLQHTSNYDFINSLSTKLIDQFLK